LQTDPERKIKNVEGEIAQNQAGIAVWNSGPGYIGHEYHELPGSGSRSKTSIP
jgi:hypothetical protein